jgi:hypothetical protein
MESVVTFNHAVGLDELRPNKDNMVVFWYECQGCWEWATTWDADDPPVYESEPGGEFEPWRGTGQTVSEFLLSAIIFDAVSGGANRVVMGGFTEEESEVLSASLEPLELAAEGRFMAGTRFLIGAGVLVEIEEPISSGSTASLDGRSQRSFRVWVSARTAEELDVFLQEFRRNAGRVREQVSDYRGESPPF